MGGRISNALIGTGVAVAALAATAILLEIALRFFPVVDALHTEPVTAANPLVRAVPDRAYTYSADWDFKNARVRRANNAGFFSEDNYVTEPGRPLVAVIGDSFVEALQVAAGQAFVARLARQQGFDGSVYAFAKSGAPLSQYVAWLRYVCETYEPDAAIITVVGNDIDESYFPLRPRDGFYHYRDGPDGRRQLVLSEYRVGPLRALAYRSSLARYLFFNLNLTATVRRLRLQWFAAANAAEHAATPSTVTAEFVGNTAAKADPERLAASRRVIARFIADISAECVARDKLAILIDGLRGAIYDPSALASAERSYWGLMRRELIAAAGDADIAVGDLQTPFVESYERDGERFEFPFDGHWSIKGHEVVAGALARSQWFKGLIATP